MKMSEIPGLQPFYAEKTANYWPIMGWGSLWTAESPLCEKIHKNREISEKVRKCGPDLRNRRYCLGNQPKPGQLPAYNAAASPLQEFFEKTTSKAVFPRS